MRRLIVGVVTVLVMTLAPAAWGHPSENRDLQSTFGGPHCHINLKTGEFAFPSHRAHIATGVNPDVIFTAATCP